MGSLTGVFLCFVPRIPGISSPLVLYETPTGDLHSQLCPKSCTGYSMLGNPPSVRSRWAPSRDRQLHCVWLTGATQTAALCAHGTLRRVGPLAGRASGIRQAGGRGPEGREEAQAGCGSPALTTQLPPRCPALPQGPETSHR